MHHRTVAQTPLMNKAFYRSQCGGQTMLQDMIRVQMPCPNFTSTTNLGTLFYRSYSKTICIHNLLYDKIHLIQPSLTSINPNNLSIHKHLINSVSVMNRKKRFYTAKGKCWTLSLKNMHRLHRKLTFKNNVFSWSSTSSSNPGPKHS